MRVRHLILPAVAALVLSAAPAAAAAGGGASAAAPAGTSPAPPAPTANTSSGGVGMAPGPVPISTAAHPMVCGSVAKIIKGVAYAPSYAPLQVQQAIWAGDQIRRKPYIYGGGHGSFIDSGYDCSGSVSYVLHAAGLLKTPFDSTDFMSWGKHGVGRWITVYTNPGHAFIEIAGIRFDTSAEADPNPPPGTGPRWRPLYPNPPGFMARHPAGL